jgi:flagellar basal-body rod protein FlgG
MIRSLWVAKTGLEAQQTNVDVISNNLANVSTNGFKRQRPVFEDLLYQTLRQPGAQSTQQTQVPSGLQMGTGVRPVATARIFTTGNLQNTGNPLDLAVNGNGFFQVTLPDGSVSYTRDGSFQLDNQGQVVTSNGYPLQPTITIPPNALSITVGSDGTVSVLAAGAAAPTQVGQIQLANFINPAGLQARGENLFLETAASGTAQTNVP